MALKKQKKIIKILFIFFVLLSLVSLRFFQIKSIKSKKDSNIDIRALATQKISKIYFKENDFVKKQDLLLEFDRTGIEMKIKHIKAKIDYEKEKLALLKFKEEKALEAYLNSKKDGKFDLKEVNSNLKTLEESQLLFKIQKAKVDLLLSELDLVKNEKKKSFVYSPIDGQIVKNFAYIGKVTFEKEKLLSISDE